MCRLILPMHLSQCSLVLPQNQQFLTYASLSNVERVAYSDPQVTIHSISRSTVQTELLTSNFTFNIVMIYSFYARGISVFYRILCMTFVQNICRERLFTT